MSNTVYYSQTKGGYACLCDSHACEYIRLANGFIDLEIVDKETEMPCWDCEIVQQEVKNCPGGACECFE